jgi:DnaK suppressor protein
MARSRTAVDQERHQVLRRMLEDRRTEIHEKLRSIRESLPSALADVKDAEEQSVNDFVQDMDFALMEMKSETLGKIDEAIQRLEQGTYGTCSECSSEIAEARLKAVPFATLCRDCQEREENRDIEERAVRTPATGSYVLSPPTLK